LSKNEKSRIAPALDLKSGGVLSLLKETGGMVLMLGVLLWLAGRNPVRNVAVVDALIAGLCILAVTPLLSLWMTDIRGMYPAYFLWGDRLCGSQ
jgi:multisubunit Na+/H+ antiporter MnhB subunit